MGKVRLKWSINTGGDWLGEVVELDLSNCEEVIEAYMKKTFPQAEKMENKWRVSIYPHTFQVSLYPDFDNVDCDNKLVHTIEEIIGRY